MSHPNPLQNYYDENQYFEDSSYQTENPELKTVEEWLNEN